MSDEATEDDFTEMMKLLQDQDPGGAKMQQFVDYMNLVGPYIKMTKEEMEIAVPNGCYDISSEKLVMMTGKQGLINIIIKTQEELGIKPG